MLRLEPGSDAWLTQVEEEIVEADRLIIDPHHHLWKKRFGRNYLLSELAGDTDSGHKIAKSLFMECHAFYLRDGPAHLRPTGETLYITDLARQSHRSDSLNSPIAGLVLHADLRLSDESDKLLEVLASHRQIAGDLFKGIRHSAAFDKRAEDLFIVNNAPEYLYGKESFRNGLRILADQNLSYDTWHYHHQNQDFLDLARTVPECTMVLDHFGTPLGVGIYKQNKDEIFQYWKQDISDIAKCHNVYLKLGGLAMPDNGFDWHLADRPPGSDEFVAAQKKYYLHAIECFGPERCMFESNFPVDRLSLSYHVLWNGFKKMVKDFSESEKHMLFYGTAEKVYRLAENGPAL